MYASSKVISLTLKCLSSRDFKVAISIYRFFNEKIVSSSYIKAKFLIFSSKLSGLKYILSIFVVVTKVLSKFEIISFLAIKGTKKIPIIDKKLLKHLEFWLFFHTISSIKYLWFYFLLLNLYQKLYLNFR